MPLCRVGFQGLVHDESTSLVYNRARTYNPRLGRFNQRDPLGYPDGLNTYAAYHVMRGGVDPWGLEVGEIVIQGAGGGAIGREVSLNGKTAVRIGGTDFFITGNPAKADPNFRGKSTSVLFIVKSSTASSRRPKMYRLDYGPIPNHGGGDLWHHNQKGVYNTRGLKLTNHSTPGAASMGRTISIAKYAGRSFFAVGMAMSAYDIYKAEDRAREITRQVGGWTGAIAGGWVGAKGGAAGGAAIGSAGAGVGAAPGAVAGGVIGGLVGGAVGWWAGTTITETIYDAIFKPAKKEEWVVVMCGDRPLRESDLE